MRCPRPQTVALVALLLAGGSTAAYTAGAQSAQAPSTGQDGHAAPNRNGTSCPPGQKGSGPTLGDNTTGENLSNQLSQSHGVICPPPGVDPEMTNPPPAEGGRMPIIPPPGTKPGDRTIPK